jgi:hypothetical protein
MIYTRIHTMYSCTCTTLHSLLQSLIGGKLVTMWVPTHDNEDQTTQS